MKKFLLAFLTFIMSLCVIGLVACDCSCNGNTNDAVPLEHKHELNYHSAVSATCTTDGNVEYWSCEGCGKNFADENAQNQITDVIIPKSHTGETEIRNAKAPTTESEGYTGDTYCLDCGQKIANGKSIDKLDHAHDMQKTDRIDETCSQNGNIEYYTCNVCSKIYKDIDGIWEITINETVITASHDLTYNERVDEGCTVDGTIAHYHCEKCDKNFLDKLGTNEITDITVIAKHHLTYNAKVDESCTKNGAIAHYHCSKCNNNYEDSEGNNQIENIIINATHLLTHHTRVNATCTVNGTKEYWACSRCNKNFSDGNGSAEIVDLVIMAGHVYGNDKVCDVCGYSIPYTISGNYMLFGSYPQTDVTSSMSNVLSYGELPRSGSLKGWTDYGYYLEGEIASYMWYKDISYNGNKYRAVYFTEYRPMGTSTESSQNSYQDDNGYYTDTVYWFKFEPIKWKILSNNGSKALIYSDLVIDGQAYQNSIVKSESTYYAADINGNILRDGGNKVFANNYAYSTIRTWLNSNFYNVAFNEFQKQIILDTLVDNSASSTSSNTNSYACKNTNDKVFLLSRKEATTATYGFLASASSTESRQKLCTDYAKAQGCYSWNMYDGFVNTFWMLRSPSTGNSVWVDYIRSDGAINSVTGSVYTDWEGVVPALNIELS